MAISDNLNSIRTHLEDDYTALEQLGVSVEDRNIENIKDMANQIYAKFPKTSYAEGSNITLSNTLKGKLDFENDIVGYGQTEQESYEGYNLAPITDNRYNLDDDNIISISRHDDNNGIRYTQFDIRSGETIYLYFIKYSNINNNTSFMGNNDNANLSFTNIQGLTNNILYKKTYTATSDITIKITMWGNANNETLKFQLWATKDEAKDTFEPYVGNFPSPSPSYPQDIEVVRGKNILNFSIVGKVPSVNGGGLVDSSYGATTELIPVYGEDYTLSYSATGAKPYVFYYGDNNTFLGSANQIDSGYTISTSIYFSSAKYIRIRTDSFSVLNNTNTQLEKGSQATSYLPYNTIEARIRGGNEFNVTDYNNIPISIQSGTSVEKSTNKLTITTSSTVSSGFYLTPARWQPLIDNFKENKTYTLSFDIIANTNTTIRAGFENAYRTLTLTANTKYRVITTTSDLNTAIIVYNTNSTANINLEITNIMISENSNLTTYEPYQTPQTYQLSLGDKELYTDSEIVRVSKNNFKFVDKFEKKRITGVPSTINTSSTNTTRITYTTGMNSNCILSNRAKCNRLKYATIWSTDEEGFYNDNNSKNVIMRMNKSVIGETNESISAYLEANETYILGELVTPIETPITDTTLINQLENFYNSQSFTGTTIIEINGQLPLIIKVRALKGN